MRYVKNNMKSPDTNENESNVTENEVYTDTEADIDDIDLDAYDYELPVDTEPEDVTEPEKASEQAEDEEVSEEAEPDSFEDKPKKNGFIEALLRAKQAGLYITSDEFLDNAIRIMLGLICLMISLINFVPGTAALILSVAAVIFCGAIVARDAFYDVTSGNILSENLIVVIISIVSLIAGHAADSALVLLVAELGFKFRDSYISKTASKAGIELDENEIDNSAKTSTREIRRIIAYGKLISCGVLGIAAIISVISLIAGGDSRMEWVHRAMVFAAAAIPAAQGAVMCLPYKLGMASLYAKGIVVKDAETMKSMSALTSVIFDKSGTISSDEYQILDIETVRISREQLLYLAAYAEEFSDHPIAKAIKAEAGIEVDNSRIIRHVEEQGAGSFVQLATNEIIAVGNLELMERLKVRGDLVPSSNTVVYVAVDRTYVGRIELMSEINPGASDTVTRLKRTGVANVALITGDNTMAANAVGKAVGVNEIYADCLPKDKYDRVRYIMDTQEKDDKLCYVCAADHDVKAMGLADVGLVIGGMNENADAMILDRNIGKTVELVNTSKSASNAVIRSLMIALAAAILTIVLGLCGIMYMWFAVLLNVGAAIFASFNAARIK